MYMNEFVMYNMLKLIGNQESIGALLKLGYSYSSVVSWFGILEELEYIYFEGDSSKFITQKGKTKLRELERKYKSKDIATLEQYKIKKMSLEEIYLP